MRFTTTVVTVLSVGLSTVTASTIFSRGQAALVHGDEHKIPGESPLELCESDHKDDILTITNVDLDPNPPQAGQTLVIKAAGLVKEQIEEGAYVNLSVKYGLIRLINTKVDLCEQIKNVDLECPIKEGILTVVKSVDLPNEIPPGKYTVLADVYTADEKHITCLTATVTFQKSGLFGSWGDL